MVKYNFIPVMLVLILMPLCHPAHSAAGETWVTFDTARAPSSVQIDTSVATFEEVIADIHIPGMEVSNLLGRGKAYQGVSIPGEGQTSQIGKPQLPMIGRYIVLPKGASARVEIISLKTTTLDGYTIYPAQPPLADSPPAPPQAFRLDPSAYRQNSYSPADMVQLEGPYVIRGHSVALLKILPLQYNPAQRSVRAASHLRVRVTFEGAQNRYGDERLHSPAYDNIVKRLALNAPALESPPPSDTALQTVDSLLIITHHDFHDAADTLAAWKREKGIVTAVHDTSETGETAQAIQAFIQEAYDTWNPAPTHVMFIGDAEFIPPHYVTSHPSGRVSQGRVGTDIYYATVDGDDYFPDLSIGRISVDTPDQAGKRVQDIINYERAPPLDSAFYRNFSVCAYFEHSSNGYTSRRFAQTSEDIALYLSTMALPGDYTANRIYETSPSVTPLYWSTVYWNFGGGPAGNPGDPIPLHLRKDIPPYFQWDGDAADISSAVNTGSFLLTHRDHGGMSNWSHPYFNTSHVRTLTNGDKLPVVWSINCQTGWFDNETDDSAGTSPEAVNFSEAWERNPDGGAIGLIAATRISYSGHNDRLFWGWTGAIWPDFLSDASHESFYDLPLYDMGTVLNYGKFYYATKFADTSFRRVGFELYHWFGDPTMAIWTAEPRNLSVSHATTILAGDTDISISVAPCDGALICATKDGQILDRAETTGGTTILSWPTPIADGEKILITVTGQNYRPYQRMATTLDICECNLDGDNDCDGSDLQIFAQDWWRRDCDLPGVAPCNCDINNDGVCDLDDWRLFVPDWGRTDCPIPPPQGLRIEY